MGHQHRVALRLPPQVDGVETRLSDLPVKWANSLDQTARRHLQTPLYVNAYCLIASTGLNSLLGLVFWTVAARLYATEDVGIASAAISTMILLAGLSSLGLDVGLVRFLPGAHRTSAILLDSTFTLVSVSSLVCAAVFLVGLPFWSPALTFAYEEPGLLAIFGLLAVATALGKVVDGAFIAHRAARFTLLRQGILNAIKIPTLVVFLVVGGASGIIASLAVAMTVSLGVALMFCLPAVQGAYSPRIRLSKKIIADILPYAVGNHLADFLVRSPQVVLPLVILNVLGPADSAYFYVTWMTANVLFAVPRSIATSMVAEGANEEGALRENAKRALGVIFVLLVPAVILALIAGGKLLLIFGREYAGRGGELLRILAVSALPVGVNHVYFATNQVKKKTGRNLVAGCLVAGVTLGLACALMTRYGTDGTGIGWLAGQGVLGVVAAASLWRYGR
jgi:O-antigen/teichoic acid export membrane protein